MSRKIGPQRGNSNRNEHQTNSENTQVRRQREANEGKERMSSQAEEEEFDGKEYRVETTDELYCLYDSTWEIDKKSTSWWTKPLRKFRYVGTSMTIYSSSHMVNFYRRVHK